MTNKIQVSANDRGRIFVIGGENADEFFDNAAGVLRDGSKAERLIEDFQILIDPQVGQAVANAAPVRPGGGYSPAPAAASAPGAPSCDHGPRSFKGAFTSKAGKEMPSSWQCQSRDRASQCKAVWNND
jgi:hypothetical protein